MRDPRPALIRDPRFREHVAPGAHPERPARLDAIDAALEPLGDRVQDFEPREATDEEILRVHGHEHLAGLRSIAGRQARIDPDTYASPRSFEVARLAAGSTVDLALRVARGEARTGFALIRPPGHHAERNRAMGFCLFNQIAMAARALRDVAGVERVAIVDWDVHHGNGTQHIFESERDVLFVSLHQYPFYPGTGALDEQGRDAGRGATLNLPLPAGCGDAEYLATFRAVVVPALLEFRPQMLLVSAGFDAHARDPLASMQVSTAGFGALAARLREVAAEVCDGRMVLALEGGYDLDGLGQAVHAVLETLAAPEAPDTPDPPPTPAARELVRTFREVHSAHWTGLRPSISA